MNQQESTLQKTLEAFSAFTATVARLRDPNGGCPWDLKQTHETLRKHMIEEAYEAASAMESPENTAELCDELGDVLLQVFLHAQLAQEAGTFSMEDILTGINEKMIRRHPHVFGEGQIKNAEEVQVQWEAIKAEEQAKNPKQALSWLPYGKIKKIHPASTQGAAIGKAKDHLPLSFIYKRYPMKDLLDEVKELQEAQAQGVEGLKEIESEIGDVYYCLSQLCREWKLDPELTAQKGNQKIMSRFEKMEKKAIERGLSIKTITREALEALWTEVKVLE